ncbi:P-loop NTPase fold protein [Bacillus cereus]|uniref:P-loop NTPase fold protein n=1 Tax=Bacillus cereus TaxID=1396 RepID=UPI0039C204D4
MDILKETILDYVSKNIVSNAILIKGKWGSGKTYYWKNILEEEINAILSGDTFERKNSSVKYISLYGIESLESLQKEVFSQFINLESIKSGESFNKIQKGRAAFAATKLIAQAAGGFFGLSGGVEQMNLQYENLLKLDNIVICFDDLERTTIDLNEVLGYINNLVEHHGVKAILLANEDEIVNENYLRIKEKIIGKTLLYEFDVESVVDGIIQSQTVSNKLLIEDLVRNKKNIIELFQRNGTNNLRILIQSFGDLESIYNVGEETLKKLKDDYKDSLIIFTLALSLAVKSNEISSSVFESTNSADEFNSKIIAANMGLRHKKYMGANSLESILEFSDNYLKGFELKRKFYKCAELLVCHGQLNKQIISDELEQVLYVQSVYPREIDLLMEFHCISDDKVQDVVEGALKQIEAGEVALFRYSVCFEIIQMLIKEEIVDLDEDIVLSRFLSGIEIIKKDGSSAESIQISHSLSQSEEPVIKELNCKIIEISQEKRRDNLRKEIEEFYTAAFSKESRGYFLQEYHRYSITLPKGVISPNDFFTKGLMEFENSELRIFNSSLRVRYNNITEIPEEEKKWLEGIKVSIETFIKNEKHKKLSHLLFNEITSTIQNILENENTASNS